LWETCTDVTVLDKLANVQSQLETIRQESRDLQSRVDNLREMASRDRVEAERQRLMVGGGAQVKACHGQAQENDRKAAEYKATLTKADKIVADLERQEAAVREQMLVP
jgi:murein L,D-transpeptidase YcbB/YkuD